MKKDLVVSFCLHHLLEFLEGRLGGEAKQWWKRQIEANIYFISPRRLLRYGWVETGGRNEIYFRPPNGMICLSMELIRGWRQRSQSALCDQSRHVRSIPNTWDFKQASFSFLKFRWIYWNHPESFVTSSLQCPRLCAAALRIKKSGGNTFWHSNVSRYLSSCVTL